MTDFKELCKELTNDLDGWLEYLANDGYQAGLWDEIQNSSRLIQRARNVLNTDNAVLFVESTQEIIRAPLQVGATNPMTQEQHPITPPDELVRQWLGNFFGSTVTGELSGSERYLATQAARWGADMELEACIRYFHEYDSSWGEDSELISGLRDARRPPAIPETIEVDGHTYRLVK